MLHSVLGINAEEISLVVQSLSALKLPELAVLYTRCLLLVDHTLFLLLKEMFSTRKDILYWSQLAKSSGLGILLHNWNSALFRYIFQPYAEYSPQHAQLRDSGRLLQHIEMLRADLVSLSVMLDELYVAAGPLKAIYLELSQLNIMSSRCGLSALMQAAESSEGGVLKSSGSYSATSTFAPPQHVTNIIEGPIESFDWQELSRTVKLLLQKALNEMSDLFAKHLSHQKFDQLVQSHAGLLSPPLMTPTPPLPHKSMSPPAAKEQRQELRGVSLECADHNEITAAALERSCSHMIDFIDELTLKNENKDFPLEMNSVAVRRPSYMEIFWIRNTVLLVGGLYTIKVLISMWMDGSLVESVNFAQDWINEKIRGHFIQPVQQLGRELFESIGRRAYVVNPEDLEESRMALRRMLDEFSKSKQGQEIIPADAQKRISEGLFQTQPRKEEHLSSEMITSAANAAGDAARGVYDQGLSVWRAFGKFAEAVVGGTKPDTADSGASEMMQSSTGCATESPSAAEKSTSMHSNTISSGIREPSVNDRNTTVASGITPEQAMDALMSEYEKELQTPLRGIMFGSLMTAILIQMQKLKVHTEAAILAMDQIMASNELTIAVTAAMPSFLFLGICIASIRSALRKENLLSRGSGTLHFRLIMSDVERSLQEVAHIAYKEDYKTKRQTSKSMIAENGAVPQSTGLPLDEWESTEPTFGGLPPLHKQQLNLQLPVHQNNMICGNCGPQYRCICCPRMAQARGMLRFNLVRLRSEFHNLFEYNPSSMNSYKTKPPSKDTASAVAARRRKGLSRVRSSRIIRGNHPLRVLKNYFGDGRRDLVPQRRPSGDADIRHSSSLLEAPSIIYNEFIGTPRQERSALRVNPHQDMTEAENEMSGRTAALDSHASDSSAHKEISVNSALQAVLQYDPTVQFSALSVFHTLYSMIFGSNELLTATTQYSSIHRDILILEAPDFATSLSTKMATAARMRVSYKCLAPTS